MPGFNHQVPCLAHRSSIRDGDNFRAWCHYLAHAGVAEFESGLDQHALAFLYTSFLLSDVNQSFDVIAVIVLIFVAVGLFQVFLRRAIERAMPWFGAEGERAIKRAH